MSRLSRLTIQARIGLSFALCIAIVIALVTFNFATLERLRSLQDEGATRARDALNVQEMEGMANALYAVVADTAINLDLEQSKTRWRDVKDEAVADLARLDTIADTPAERASAGEARAAFDRMVSLYEGQLLPALTASRAVTPDVKAIDGQIDEQVQGMRRSSAAMVASIRQESEKGDADFDARATLAAWWSIALSLGGVGCLLAVAAVLVRDIKKALRGMAGELRAGAQQVVSASAQVAGASQALSQGATEQAASLEETSASMEEMASMTRKNAENAAQAAAEVARTERLTGSADAALIELTSTMTAIRESSGKVTRIIKTIDEIAFQTNILALNAAVEAARAGEAGMGFAVVADEVRNLAQRSLTAAKDTAALIEESAGAAEAGGAKVDAVVSVVQSITESSTRVKNLVDEVSLASRQQAQGIDQVTQAITQMEKVTQTTAATAEESAAASEELNAQAEHSMEAVQQLETMVGAAAVTQQAPTAARPANVVAMRRRPTAVPAPKPFSAEHAIPFGDSGTYGSF